MNIGIDKISMYVPKTYLDISDLAMARNVDVDKYLIGLGQNKMSINNKSQDIVTMGALAAKKILEKDDIENIDMIIVGTETSVDQSKAAAVFIHSLLKLNKFCRSIEIKQACYGATAALQYARLHITKNPNSKVLVIASDIAKYGKNTAGEATQGSGAVAMIISKNPRILILNDDSICYTEDVMDFFRPNNSNYAIARGKLSMEMYIKSFNTVYYEYLRKYKENIQAICFHIPYTKLGYKALKTVSEDEKLFLEYQNSIKYNKEIGNIYTGSLFLSLISLLENSNTLNTDDTIAFYSYGSGSVSEFFTGKLVEGYKNHLFEKENKEYLNNRIRLNIEEYEKTFFDDLEEEIEYINITNEEIYLKGIFDKERKYAYGTI